MVEELPVGELVAAAGPGELLVALGAGFHLNMVGNVNRSRHRIEIRYIMLKVCVHNEIIQSIYPYWLSICLNWILGRMCFLPGKVF